MWESSTGLDEHSDQVDEKSMSTLIGQSGMSGADGRRPDGDHVVSTGGLAIIAAVVSVALVLVYWQFFRGQVLMAIAKPSDWGHTFAVPIIALWFVWLRRDELLAEPLKPAWTGIIFVALGIAIYMLGSVGPKQLIHHLTRAVGVYSTVFGLVGLFVGWRSLRVLGFPLCYVFVFGVVISDRIMIPVTNELQDIAAKGAWMLLSIIGYDVDLSGNTITLFKGGLAYPLNIAEACSGMRMLVAFLALGTAMAYIGLARNWQRALLIILGVPVAIFVNVLRVVTLGLLSLKDVHFAAGDFHTFIGLVWLIPAFLVFILLMWVVRKMVVEGPRTEGAPPQDGNGQIRFKTPIYFKAVVACVVLFVGAVSVQAALQQLKVFLEKKPIPLQASLDTVPMHLSGWTRFGKDQEYGAAIIESLGTTQYIDRNYLRDTAVGTVPISLHVSYYTGTIDDVPHIPERCWHAAGLAVLGTTKVIPITLDESEWSLDENINQATGQHYKVASVTHPVTGEGKEVRLPVGDLELMTTVFEDPQKPDHRRVGGYLFIANGRLTASSFGVRNLAFNWTDEYAYYCKIQFSALYQVSNDGEEFLDIYIDSVTEIMQDLLPQVMRCLPDWAEIEADTTTVSNIDS